MNYNQKLAQYNVGKDAVSSGKTAYNEGKAQLDAGWDAYNEGSEQLKNYDKAKAQYDKAKAQYDESLAAYNKLTKAISDLEAKGVPHCVALAMVSVSAGQRITDDSLAEMKSQLDSAKKQLDTAKKQLDQAAKAKEQLKDAKNQLEKGESELNNAKSQLAAGEKQISELEKEISGGQGKLNEQQKAISAPSLKRPRPILTPEARNSRHMRTHPKRHKEAATISSTRATVRQRMTTQPYFPRHRSTRIWLFAFIHQIYYLQVQEELLLIFSQLRLTSL